jgi:hypothetical protein
MSNDPGAAGQGRPIEEQLASLAELVETGPIDFGCYTQAELAVVLGEAPALAGLADDVLAEGVRSLAARGLLFRSPDGDHVDVVGELGLIAALLPLNTGVFEIRRGHAGAPDQPWRWMIAVLPLGVAGVDRVDPLGLHRLSLISVTGLAKTVAERVIDGPARVPEGDPAPAPMTVDEVRTAAEQAQARWQITHRLRRPDGTLRETEVQVLRTGPDRVDLLTRDPDADGYHRTALDVESLRALLVQLALSS